MYESELCKITEIDRGNLGHDVSNTDNTNCNNTSQKKDRKFTDFIPKMF